jgi:hypothetical protein
MATASIISLCPGRNSSNPNISRRSVLGSVMEYLLTFLLFDWMSHRAQLQASSFGSLAEN